MLFIFSIFMFYLGFPSDSAGKEPTCQWKRETQKIWVRSLDQEDALEKEIATHSSILAWKIPWTEKPGGLQSMGLQRVRQDCATELTCIPWTGSTRVSSWYGEIFWLQTMGHLPFPSPVPFCILLALPPTPRSTPSLSFPLSKSDLSL